MAIKRCPYCRALIDEKDQYCNNCGTQLLFPEDGSIEEEIPGEKIIDADVEEKDYEIPEPGAQHEDDEEEKDDDEPEEVILVDEISAVENSPESKTVTPEAILSPEVEKIEEKEPEEVRPGNEISVPTPEPEISDLLAAEKPVEEFQSLQAESESQMTAVPPESPPDEKAGKTPEPVAEEELPAEQKPMTFDTRDLDKIGRTAELGKEQIEKFLEALKEGAENSDILKGVVPGNDESLPPWASGMKETPEAGRTEEAADMSEEDAGDRELEQREEMDAAAGEDLIEEEVRDERPIPRIADSGMGLPEKVTQAPLPFEKPIPRDAAAAEGPRAPARREWPLREEREEDAEKEEEEEPREERPRPPFRLSVFLKAKSFDVLFVAVFWLVSLWLAARSMDVSLFQMIGAASTGLFVFLGILLGLYFFLFYFFLGETLGDRLFRDED
jgi:hypothetical protein